MTDAAAMRPGIVEMRAMAEALALARRGLYTTAPNPRVGCVLLREGRIIGRGWHRRAGEPHAEALALQEAGDARGASAFVSLEPCAHQGRTPPCSQALIDAGVRRVFAAVRDPNPRVAGQGLAALTAAGVEVHCGLQEAAARALNPGHFHRFETGRPWLRCKLAMSLDGRTAMASGESQWITGAAARRDVQAWRARSCALMTGIGTVLADDPRLDVRASELALDQAAELARRQPLKVVLDSRLRLPADRRLLGGGPVLVFCARDDPAARQRLQALGVETVVVPAGADGLELRAVLAELGRREINEILLEAGPTLAGALLRAGLVDELLLYQAPKLLGSQARPLFALPLDEMAQSVGLEIVDWRRVGEDMRLTARPLRSTALQSATRA